MNKYKERANSYKRLVKRLDRISAVITLKISNDTQGIRKETHLKKLNYRMQKATLVSILYIIHKDKKS
jgi:hypothetical protein